jgi:two-component system, sensor histidine kinase LadS
MQPIRSDHHKRTLPALLLALLCLVAWPAASEIRSIQLAEGFSHLPITGVEILHDSSLALDDVLRRPDSDWQAVDGTVNLGLSTQPVWVRFALLRDSRMAPDTLLEVAYPLLDTLDLHVLRAGQVVGSHALGDTRLAAARPVFHRNFVVPVQLSDTVPTEIYIRAQTIGTLALPLHLWTPAALVGHEQSQLPVRGLLYGAILTLLAVFLLAAVATRESTYLWYVLFILGLTGYQSTIDGITLQFLWPDRLWWHQHSLPAMIWAAFGAAILFARRFLDAAGNDTWFSRHTGKILALCILLLALVPVAPVHIMYLLMVPGALVFCTGGLVYGAQCWLRGDRAAPFFVMALVCFMVGGLFAALRQAGSLQHGGIGDHALLVAIFLQAIVLAWALALRLRDEKLQRLAVQEDMLQAQVRHANELEDKVTLRTHELQQAMDQLEVMNLQLAEQSRRDGLTGLHNRRHFDERFAVLVAQAVRRREALAVMMLDLDHFKKLNDTRGHPAGDACLREVAVVLQGMMRSTDLLARYGGEEFVLALPTTDAGNAMQIAERLRQRIEQLSVRHEGDCFNVTCSIGIAATVPADSVRAMALLNEADDALYAAKRGGRNRIAVNELPA